MTEVISVGMGPADVGGVVSNLAPHDLEDFICALNY